MTIKTTDKFIATITLGLQKGYTDDLWTKTEVITILQNIQEGLIAEKQLYLSASVSECDIVLSGQVEPSIKLDFINYPKFPLEKTIFEHEVLVLVKQLMERLLQNRGVIVFHDEIVMLENTDEIDNRITKNHL